MAGINFVSLVLSKRLDELKALRSGYPVSRIIIGYNHVTLFKFLRVDPLDVALFAELTEVILDRGFTEIGALIPEISVKNFSRESQTAVYEKGEHTLFALGFAHTATITSVGNITIGFVRSVRYRVIRTTYGHNYPMRGKLFNRWAYDEYTWISLADSARPRKRADRVCARPTPVGSYGTRTMEQNSRNDLKALDSSRPKEQDTGGISGLLKNLLSGRGTDAATDLSLSESIELLDNERRRALIRLLAERGHVSLGVAAEQIAAAENDCRVAELTSQQRKRVYVSLYQTHLETLEEAGVVDYDDSTRVISPTAETDPLADLLSAFDNRTGGGR